MMRSIQRMVLATALVAGFGAAAWAQARWPQNHQESDGRFDPGTMAAICAKDHPTTTCGTPGLSSEAVSATALVLLTRSSAGYGLDYRTNVYTESSTRAIKWLIAQQKDDGQIGDPADPRRVFAHAWALMALVESPTSQHGPLTYPYKSIAARAAAYALAQRDAGGIWRAGETRGAPDLAATGLTLMALAIAKSHGIEVKSELVLPALALCEGYLMGGARLADGSAPTDESTYPATSRRSLTALALIARSLWNGGGATLGKLDEDALNSLAAEPLTADDRDQTGFFLSALALGRAAGDRWIEFTKKMKPILFDTQLKNEGPVYGSWPAVDPFARIGGTYYCSGMMTLALELYYRYPRVVGMPADAAK